MNIYLVGKFCRRHFQRAVSANVSTFRRSAHIALLAFGTILLAASAARATGPDNQLVPQPALPGFNTLSSVVAVVGTDGTTGKINNRGTGTIIDSFLNPATNNRFLCVLTADHVVTGGVNSIVFPNYTFNAAPPAAGTYPIIGSMQIPGIGVGQNVDANVVLVRYGVADAFYFGVPNKKIAAASAKNDKLAEVGFGQTGTANLVAGKLDSITQQAAPDTPALRSKRFQNNLLTDFVANNPHVANAINYKENDVTYTFDKETAAGFIPGEGFGFPGDSGAPLFNDGVSFDPGGGLPKVVSTDMIAGLDVFGPVGVINNGAVEFTVDTVFYSANIKAACMALQATIPEPSTWLLLSMGICALLVAHRRGRPTK
jgi:PEP-CTERM motif